MKDETLNKKIDKLIDQVKKISKSLNKIERKQRLCYKCSDELHIRI